MCHRRNKTRRKSDIKLTWSDMLTSQTCLNVNGDLERVYTWIFQEKFLSLVKILFYSETVYFQFPIKRKKKILDYKCGLTLLGPTVSVIGQVSTNFWSPSVCFWTYRTLNLINWTPKGEWRSKALERTKKAIGEASGDLFKNKTANDILQESTVEINRYRTYYESILELQQLINWKKEEKKRFRIIQLIGKINI